MKIACRAGTFANGNGPTRIFIIKSHGMGRWMWRTWWRGLMMCYWTSHLSLWWWFRWIGLMRGIRMRGDVGTMFGIGAYLKV